jgi:hypothetical protein
MENLGWIRDFSRDATISELQYAQQNVTLRTVFSEVNTSVCLLKPEFYKVISSNCINKDGNMSV